MSKGVVVNRKEFLKLYGGMVAGLSIPGVLKGLNDVAEPRSGAREGRALGDQYLVAGLTGMVRADGWFNAHWGAGILAGFYLCRDNALGAETILGIQAQLDAVIASQPERFAPLPIERVDSALIERIPEALAPALRGGLRAHGHAAIFAALSIRALRDIPEMATPSIIEGLCELSRQIAVKPPERPEAPVVEYSDTQAMIEALFDSLVRFKGLLGRPGIRRPNFTHMVTHTEALMNLELMGYRDLARVGYLGQQAHIAAPVPAVDPTTETLAEDASLESVMSEGYWNNEANEARWNREWSVEDNPNGYWVAYGHLFKVLYSYHRLLGRIADQEKVSLCSRILLERYMNPAVQGG